MNFVSIGFLKSKVRFPAFGYLICVAKWRCGQLPFILKWTVTEESGVFRGYFRKNLHAAHVCWKKFASSSRSEAHTSKF